MYDTALSQLLAYHGRMLGDEVRIEAYRDALAQIVRPGDVVVDLGSGTGILALFACQNGARKVYAVERGRIAMLAQRLIHANGCSDRVALVTGESTALTLPERADVLVTETLWNFGLGEGLLDSVADARDRLLVAGARIIPSGLELMAAPVELPSFFERFDIWNEERLGLNLSSVRSTAFAVLYPVRADVDALLAQASCIASIDLGKFIDTRGNVGGEARFSIQRDGTMHGLLGWFRAKLAPNVHITNGPSSPRTSWQQALLALDPPLSVLCGDSVSARIDAIADGSIWRWRVEQLRDGSVIAHRKHSTLEAFARFGISPPRAPVE